MCVQTHTTVLLWRSKESLRELVLFLRLPGLMLSSTEPSHQPDDDKDLNDEAKKSEELTLCTHPFMVCQGDRLSWLRHEYAEMQAFYEH